MATTRIIDCIGASDEDIAHLRLLLRSSIIHLRDVWRWEIGRASCRERV